MAAEAYEEILHEEVKRRLIAIKGDAAYHYNPDQVWRVGELPDPSIFGESKLAYYIFPGDGFFEPETQCGYNNVVSVFVMAVMRYGASTRMPWTMESEGLDPTSRIKFRLQHDVRRAMFAGTLPDEIQRLWVADRNFEMWTKDNSYLLAEFQLSAEFSEVLA